MPKYPIHGGPVFLRPRPCRCCSQGKCTAGSKPI